MCVTLARCVSALMIERIRWRSLLLSLFPRFAGIAGAKTNVNLRVRSKRVNFAFAVKERKRFSPRAKSFAPTTKQDSLMLTACAVTGKGHGEETPRYE